jgi:hypothetical protein
MNANGVAGWAMGSSVGSTLVEQKRMLRILDLRVIFTRKNGSTSVEQISNYLICAVLTPQERYSKPDIILAFIRVHSRSFAFSFPALAQAPA